jgi:hypothetical protein
MFSVSLVIKCLREGSKLQMTRTLRTTIVRILKILVIDSSLVIFAVYSILG